MKEKVLKIGGLKISNSSEFVLIAGPCVIESEKTTFKIAEALTTITEKLDIPLIFKASYDKANRSSVSSYRGPGIESGLKILSSVKKEFKLPILTDVHGVDEVERASWVADILQVPAYLCRQTDLVLACAKTGLAVNVKKGQFISPYDIKNIIGKIESRGNRNIMLTERGAMFGYNNLVTDIRSLVIMKDTGYPVIFDATHSVQIPGGLGACSGGERRFVEPLAKASLSTGIAGVFMEVHPNPEKALSDGANSIALSQLQGLLSRLKEIDNTVKK
jgi:2-dehydro-3-deoxyphosphooctonate aldolase (KDO 8-P synthase)